MSQAQTVVVSRSLNPQASSSFAPPTNNSIVPTLRAPQTSSRPPQSGRFSVPVRALRRPSTHPATVVPSRAPRERRTRQLSLEALLPLYTPLVQKIVGGFQRKLPRNVLRDDLLAAGMIGLWDAIQRHGAEANEGFEWYVRVRIRGAILDELRAQDWLPRRMRSAMNSEHPSIAPSVVRLEDMNEWEHGKCLAQQASGEAELCERSDHEALSEAVELLPERERFIVREHYYKGVKFKELSVELGVSEPRISQLHSRAMKRLKDIVHTAQNA
jgi:RNA polymerase sigma factor FliA